ncbi:MAG: helix-turn-helix domain-containing protein [Saprospiraceae bacterium]
MQTILNQLVYFGYLQSLFLLFIYWFSPKNRQQINGYLAFFVIVLAIGLTGRMLYISEAFGQNYRLITFSEFATLLFGATIYLFTRSTLYPQPFDRKDLLHYVPALIYNSAVTLVFIVPTDAQMEERIASGWQFIYIVIFVGIGLSANIAYWAASLRLFLRFRKQMQDELSYVVKSQFFLNFLIAVAGCLTFWLTLYILGLFRYPIFNRTIWQFVWLSLAIIILFITYYGMVEPDLYRITPLVNEPKKYSQSKLKLNDLDQLKTRLDQLMEEQKPYLNRKLLKSELAEMLGVSNPDIARLLNERIGMNFFEYINYYRIKEFIQLAQSEKAQQLTLFGIAQEAGFNSKTTFNKSFKKLMGTSPSAYFSQQK